MAWKATGRPIVRQQRERWVVRIDGIETTTGKARPRQIGTYPSRRAAQKAATAAAAEDLGPVVRGTVSWLVHRWVASKTDISVKGRAQYEWAAGHIDRGLGPVRLDQLDRDDIARWLEELAQGGKYSRRSIQIFRNVLKAALADATDEGLLRRNPAARVPMPRDVVKSGLVREAEAWTQEQVATFLKSILDHRLAGPIRLEVLYGLRRSEILALKWNNVSFANNTVSIDAGLVDVKGGVDWTPGKTARSRRTIPVDETTMTALKAHRVAQNAERLRAGGEWTDLDLVMTTRTGNYIEPRNFDAILDRLIARTDLPRLTSHGFRHTAATLMVRNSADVGELRAVADILGHSPDMLMKVYAHTVPDSLRSVVEKIGNRSDAPGPGGKRDVRVKGAAKNGRGGDGFADLVLNDRTVAEVKSAGVGARKAKAEAQWYADHIAGGTIAKLSDSGWPKEGLTVDKANRIIEWFMDDDGAYLYTVMGDPTPVIFSHEPQTNDEPNDEPRRDDLPKQEPHHDDDPGFRITPTEVAVGGAVVVGACVASGVCEVGGAIAGIGTGATAAYNWIFG